MSGGTARKEFLEEKKQEEIIEGTQKTLSDEIDEEIRAEHTNERADGLFDDWKNDNLEELKKDFLEKNEDNFKEFCKEAFKFWRGER